MNGKRKIISSLLITSFLFISNINAASFFSGYAGGKIDYSAAPDVEEYNPNLKLQAFFASQFNFSQNVWSHLEFSIDTADFLNESIFQETDAAFQIDEASLIFRGNMEHSTNYFSTFMGTYDPIGSDVFLKRYFGIKSITSKITDSYLGLAGSILYPQFGVGISDVVKIHSAPLAFGGYIYLNHEDSKYYVFNADLRSAGAFRQGIWDFAFGIGVPLADKYKGDDVIIAIDKIYWHAGTTLLLGNNYTNSFFLQAGLYNAAFTAKDENIIVSPEDIYLLVEPRFLVQNFHINLSFYSLPQATIKKLLFVEDSLGIDMNLYSDSVMVGSKIMNIGSHISASFSKKNLLDLKDISNLSSDGYNINITPYVTTDFLSGELHVQSKLRLLEISDTPAKCFSLDVGYRTTF